ncbi:MAG TPA: hypothetical protein VF476_11680 [Chitinophagaceae bacterium]
MTLKNIVDELDLKHPVKEITDKTGFIKGNVSRYINGKVKYSDSFLRKFCEVYSLDYKEIKKKLTEDTDEYSISVGNDDRYEIDSLIAKRLKEAEQKIAELSAELKLNSRISLAQQKALSAQNSALRWLLEKMAVKVLDLSPEKIEKMTSKRYDDALLEYHIGDN